MRVRAKKRTGPEDGLHGAVILSVSVTERRSEGPWKDSTPQLEVRYLLDCGMETVDWMPLKGYARDGDGYAVDPSGGERVENLEATKRCLSRVSDMLACAGVPEGEDAHIGELAGRRLQVCIGRTEEGKYYVRYHRKSNQ